MLDFYMIGHNFKYETENVLRLFFSYDEIKFYYELDDNLSNNYIIAQINENICAVCFCLDGAKTKTTGLLDNDKEHLICSLLYHTLSEHFNKKLPYGLLTGIRPVKKFMQTEGNAKEIFLKKFLVSERKVELIGRCASLQQKIMPTKDNKNFSLYISIPFCPSRCHYCSFISHDISKNNFIIEDYIDILIDEIKEVAAIARENRLVLKTVYFGGGTPAILSPTQIIKIGDVIAENFDFSQLIEYTFEAGRADVITKEKLAAVKKIGADRISINPQTFNDDVLKIIGRNHTGAQVMDSFSLARDVDFCAINADLIAGLPGENFDSFVKNLDILTSLNSENITVHTLSVKRSALMKQDQKKILEDTKLTEKMADFAFTYLTDKGYRPYYLYRQKSTVGALENIGYSKAGKEGYYNMLIMDESHTILACGAGGVSKLVDTSSGKISRAYNYKFPFEYIKDLEKGKKNLQFIREFYKTL